MQIKSNEHHINTFLQKSFPKSSDKERQDYKSSLIDFFALLDQVNRRVGIVDIPKKEIKEGGV